MEYTIVVVDEISMVPKSMIDLLLSHKIFVIFLGDPFQLMQINKEDSHDLLESPHIFLDEIMRQAKESEIIQLTMAIREGKPINYFKGKEVIVCPKSELSTGQLLWADIVISATNATRHDLNKQIRKLKGFTKELEENDKLLVKRNYWEDCSEDGEALVNGTIGYVKNVFESFIILPRAVDQMKSHIPIYIGDFTSENGSSFGNVDIDKNFLLKEEPCVDWRVAYKLGKMKNRIGDILPRQLTYGYTVTCHVAQGSQWNKVLVIEESFPFDKEEHRRWLYTSVSRSSERCVLIR